MSRISEDVGKVRMYFGPAIMYSLNMITLFIVALIYMWNQAPTLTLYTVLPLPILSVAIYYLSKVIHKRSTIVQEYLAKLSTFTQESFSGISVIKAYGIEPQTNVDFEALSLEQREKQIDLARIRAFFFPLMICKEFGNQYSRHFPGSVRSQRICFRCPIIQVSLIALSSPSICSANSFSSTVRHLEIL